MKIWFGATSSGLDEYAEDYKIIRDYLKSRGHVILSDWIEGAQESRKYNRARPIKRIYKSKKRPLVMKLNKNQIRNLINERLKYYNLSDHKIDCDKLDKVEIINKILNIYEDRKN